VGSKEGPDQLARYAELLATNYSSGDRHKILLYITRTFDPKAQAEILKKVPSGTVRFKQTRWYNFYQFLQSQPQNIFIDETIAFMQENGMSQDNQFTPVDVLALANFSKALGLMDATLEAEVGAEFEKIIGVPRKSGRAHVWFLLKEWRLYGLTAYFDPDWWCLLGYRLNVVNSVTDYPDLGIVLQIQKKSGYEPEIISAMREIEKRTEWHSYNLDKPDEWPFVARTRSLRSFLSEEDHITAIKDYFLALLKELDEIKRAYPHLPWGVSPQGKMEDEDDENS
jgi:hypothetical protein